MDPSVLEGGNGSYLYFENIFVTSRIRMIRMFITNAILVMILLQNGLEFDLSSKLNHFKCTALIFEKIRLHILLYMQI